MTPSHLLQFTRKVDYKLKFDNWTASYESYEADTKLSKSKKQKKTSFYLTFRNIDDVLSLNNPKCNDYIDVIYPKELEITDAPKWSNYLDHLEFDEEGKLGRLYDKYDDFDFHIVNFPYLSSNIPESPAYGVFVSQLIRYGFVQNMKIYSGFKVIETGIFLTENFMVVIQTLFTNLTPLCHIC